ncbi:matrin-3-like [Notothenia coriiceps]|uniref:Matrin-3-like n=1 Tax=Notothenia coriiceps TaxID=8208 RepID=A0A6I9PDB2_9TELE|nr:PREDICTED: matrin-3-like [Notothenia coriiceps]
MSEVENTAEECVKKKKKMDTAISTGYSLPPFDPTSPVGMEFLTPKTGFFCKVCNRFFNGTKEAEINHCKTLKHYESLQVGNMHTHIPVVVSW